MIETWYVTGLAFIFAIVVLLGFYPNEKIVVIGEFLKNVLPRIPMTGIAKVLKKKRKRKDSGNA